MKSNNDDRQDDKVRSQELGSLLPNPLDMQQDALESNIPNPTTRKRSSNTTKKTTRSKVRSTNTKSDYERKHNKKQLFFFEKSIYIARIILIVLVVIAYVRYQFLSTGRYHDSELYSNKDTVTNSMSQEQEQQLQSFQSGLQMSYDSSNINNSISLIKKPEDEMKIISRHAKLPTKYSIPNPTLSIPQNIEINYADVIKSPPSENSNVNETNTKAVIPVFWHILKSGGTTIKDMYGACYHMVEASESGVLNGHIDDSELKVVQIAADGIHYVNVDTTTAVGISRAVQMNLIPSQLSDIIFTPLLHESSQLFANTNYQGQIFTMIRHPVERALSLFYYLKKASWEPTFSEKLKDINSVEDYAISIFAENNWMVRFLTNKMTEQLTNQDLEVAKEILRRKVLIGLLIDIEESVRRFNMYFDWGKNKQLLDENMVNINLECIDTYLISGSNKNMHELAEENGIGWRILSSNNLLDLELYEYALQLYQEQSVLFPK